MIDIMSQDPATVVREVLQEYADRGVFRALREVRTRGGRAEFSILCFPFTEEPFTLIYAAGSQSLTFKNLLKDIPARSDMYCQFKEYMKERTSPDLPDHRRIDPDRAELKWSNRLGSVNVSLHVKGNQHEYAVRKGMNLLTDIFLDLLTESTYYEYMISHFDMPEE